MFMGAVVINNQMNIQIVGYIFVNMLEKIEELVVAVLVLRQYFPGGYIQDDKQRCDVVTGIIMGRTFHKPSPNGSMA
ncbi:hypothetical protein [Candidatus Synechococcus spongiarum]|uniref:hypothetical protein n=1 Tax=Candidatus Synechococcus spongiarum TaxID=431041 RepID=UPI0011789464|nr:hypothetical protein [Candidatus Synechococcus spongiarum]